MHTQYNQNVGPQGPRESPMLIEGLTGPTGPAMEEEWSWMIPGTDIQLDATQTALFFGGWIALFLALYFFFRPKSDGFVMGPMPVEAMRSRPMLVRPSLPKKKPAAAKKRSPKKTKKMIM